MPLHEYQKQMYTKVAVVAALIILPVAGFFAGMTYQKQMTPATDATNGPKQIMGGPRMLRNGTLGTVKSVNETSITITERKSQEDKTYTLSSSTTYKDGESTAQFSDVKVGDTVMLTLDKDDNTKVTTVALNPMTMLRDGSGSGSSDVMVQ